VKDLRHGRDFRVPSWKKYPHVAATSFFMFCSDCQVPGGSLQMSCRRSSLNSRRKNPLAPLHEGSARWFGRFRTNSYHAIRSWMHYRRSQGEASLERSNARVHQPPAVENTRASQIDAIFIHSKRLFGKRCTTIVRSNCFCTVVTQPPCRIRSNGIVALVLGA